MQPYHNSYTHGKSQLKLLSGIAHIATNRHAFRHISVCRYISVMWQRVSNFKKKKQLIAISVIYLTAKPCATPQNI